MSVSSGDTLEGGAVTVTAGETTANSQVAGTISITSGYGSSTTAGQGGHFKVDAGAWQRWYWWFDLVYNRDQ